MNPNSSDSDLHEFFSGMRRADEALVPPAIGIRRKSRRTLFLLPIAVAASWLLAWLLWPVKESTLDHYPNELIVITLKEFDNAQQRITIEEKTYLDIWESPTETLLVDFDPGLTNF